MGDLVTRGQSTVVRREGEQRLYEQMYLIRRLEESLLDLFAAGKLVGTTHTCIGQEANAAGVIAHLEHGRDAIVSNHRCHGHYVAFTDDVFGLVCEVMGKQAGVCGGKGGSQHLCNNGFYSNGVLGSTLPVAAGMALAERERGSGAVTTVFMGDGALGQGVVYETFNIASLWSLPLLFVLENNFYAQSTPQHLNLAGSIVDRARAFGIEALQLKTTDVTEIHTAAGEAIDRMRERPAPFFLVVDTYRFSPHSKGDDFRDAAEIDAARRRDPLTIAAARLDGKDVQAIQDECEARLHETIETADASPAAVAE
jgi:TPP-dependent pyruvate/acetoin dehydrogenase alpha subunit